MNPKISVVMSVYNTQEDWLREAIESILAQTYRDFEFIIINDGSSNNAEEVILSYKDERIKYIYQENQGLARALNNGIEIAKGEYIARMDSDDISLPERFEKQIAYFENNPEVSVLGTWLEHFPDKRLVEYPKEPKFMDMLESCCVGHPTVMFRKSDFEKYDLKYNPDYKCEDYELWSRAIIKVKFANLEEVLLKYRWHEKNLSKASAKKFKQSIKKVKSNMLSYLTDDKGEQRRIMKEISKKNKEQDTFLEKIYSLKLSEDNLRYHLTIFGLKLKFRKKD